MCMEQNYAYNKIVQKYSHKYTVEHQTPWGLGGWECVHQDVHASCGAHTFSSAVGTDGSFPGGKAAWVWSWPSPSCAEV